MGNIQWPSHLAYYPEAGPGESPADETAWGTSGLPIRHDPLSLTVDGFVQTPIEDTRNQGIGFGLERKQRGLRNGEFPFDLHLHGSEAVPADDAVVVQTRVSRLLEHCLGGEHLGRRTTAKVAGTHTTTSVELTNSTDFVLGEMVNVVDADAPLTANPRRVISIAGDIIGFDEALPFTPVDGDIVHAMITSYIDEAIIADSHANNNTFAWHIQKGLPALGSELWEAQCCKSALTSIAVGRDDLMRGSIQTMFADWQGPNDLVAPTWSNAEEGLAGTVIGPTGRLFLQDYGSTVQKSFKVESIGIDVGVPVTRIPTVTEDTANSPGTGLYAFGPAETLITLNLVHLTSALWDDWDDDVFKQMRYSTRRQAGNVMAIACPRCEVVQSPVRGQAADVSSTQVVLRAHPDTTAVATTALWRSKILIGHG